MVQVLSRLVQVVNLSWLHQSMDGSWYKTFHCGPTISSSLIGFATDSDSYDAIKDVKKSCCKCFVVSPL